MIEPIIRAAGVRSICEIGSDQGITSRHIIQFSVQNGLACHIVDPAAAPGLSSSAEQNVNIHCCISLDFLQSASRCDMYIVDGDHNYWTVSRECVEIARHAGQERPLIVLFHDTAWPCARRDSYYATGSVPEMRPHRFKTGLRIDDERLNAGRSFPGGDTFAWGEEHGAPGVGVLTALEDSVFCDPAAWCRLSIPSFYGMSLFVERAPMTAALSQLLDELSRAVRFLGPLLAIHEANRLRLLQGLMETQSHLREVLAKDDQG